MFAASLANIVPWFAGSLFLLATIGLVGSCWERQRLDAAPKDSRTSQWCEVVIHVGLLAFFLAVGIYGSFVPFEFSPLPLSTAIARFRALAISPLWFYSRSDAIANTLLGVPIGFFGAAVLGVSHHRPFRLAWKCALVVFLTATYSCALEFSQFWFPMRTPSQADIATQVLGAILGVVAWIIGGKLLTRAAATLFFGGGDGDSRRVAFFAYAALLLCYSILPLDLTLSPADLYHKWKDGLIVFWPTTGVDLSLAKASNTLSNSLMFSAVGALATAARFRRHQPPVPTATLWGFAIAFAVECAQLLVVGRYTKAFDILNGTISAGLGSWFAAGLIPAQPSLNRNAVTSPHFANPARLFWILVVGWSFALIIVYCLPFEVLTDPARIAKRLAGLSRTPFGSLYWSNPLGALETVLQKFLLFAPLGLLAGYGIEHWSSKRSTKMALNVVALCLLALFATFIEFLQVYFPPHIADLTDAGLATAAAAIGLLIASRITTPSLPPPSEPGNDNHSSRRAPQYRQ